MEKLNAGQARKSAERFCSLESSGILISARKFEQNKICIFNPAYGAIKKYLYANCKVRLKFPYENSPLEVVQVVASCL